MRGPACLLPRWGQSVRPATMGRFSEAPLRGLRQDSNSGVSSDVLAEVMSALFISRI